MRTLLFACALLLVMVSSAAAVNIAFVSFHPADNQPSAGAATVGFTEAPDKGYTDLLTANGHTVTRFLTTDTPNVSLLNTFDVVILSRSVDSGHYELDLETRAWNTGIYKPLITLGAYPIRNVRLGYTTGGTIPDTTGQISLAVTNPAHPIFNGISLSGGAMTNPYTTGLVTLPFQQGGINTVQRGISVNTDDIAGGGTVLATVATAGDPAVNEMIIGKWEPGSRMSTSPVDYLGGHRLVFLTGSREHAATTTPPAPSSSQIAGIMDLTADGKSMLLNAVNYMAGLGGMPLSDVNGDGAGNTSDYNIIRQNFHGTGKTRAQGDLNYDTLVNYADFRIWKDNRTGAGAGTAFEFGDPVPEPASVALALFGALGVFGAAARRRGR